MKIPIKSSDAFTYCTIGAFLSRMTTGFTAQRNVHVIDDVVKMFNNRDFAICLANCITTTGTHTTTVYMSSCTTPAIL